MKISLTIVNKSSRFNPWTSLLAFCCWDTGLELWMNRDISCGSSPSSPVRAAPKSSSLTTRVPRLIQSGRWMKSKLNGNSQIGISTAPPPTWRQAPTNAGRELTRRTASPPPGLRSRATPSRIAEGWMVAYSRASLRIKTGEILWSDVLPAGGQATPIVYEQDGKEYLVIMAGGHHFMMTPPGDALIAYALPDTK